jgi:hypothetical protein
MQGLFTLIDATLGLLFCGLGLAASVSSYLLVKRIRRAEIVTPYDDSIQERLFRRRARTERLLKLWLVLAVSELVLLALGFYFLGGPLFAVLLGLVFAIPVLRQGRPVAADYDPLEEIVRSLEIRMSLLGEGENLLEERIVSVMDARGMSQEDRWRLIYYLSKHDDAIGSAAKGIFRQELSGHKGPQRVQ